MLLLLLVLHIVVVDAKLLVAVGKAASFLIWTALRALEKLALHSLEVRVILSLGTTLVVLFIKVVILRSLIHGLNLSLLSSQSILNLLLSKGLVLLTQLLSSMSKLAAITDLASAQALKMTA